MNSFLEIDPSSPRVNLKVVSSCSLNWENMDGDDKKRLCAQCNLHVHNLSRMTSDEIDSLLDTPDRRVCVRLEKQVDKEPLTAVRTTTTHQLKDWCCRIWRRIIAALICLLPLNIGAHAQDESQSAKWYQNISSPIPKRIESSPESLSFVTPNVPTVCATDPKVHATMGVIDMNVACFMQRLQTRILRRFNVIDFKGTYRIVVTFRLHKSGRVSHLKLIHSSGEKSVDEAAMQSVRLGAPFDGLSWLTDDFVDIQFTFDKAVIRK